MPNTDKINKVDDVKRPHDRAIQSRHAQPPDHLIGPGDGQHGDQRQPHPLVDDNRPQPRSAGDWNDMGELYFKTGSYEQAIKAFNQAIELEPLFVKAWYNKKMASELQLKKSSAKVRYRVSRVSHNRKD